MINWHWRWVLHHSSQHPFHRERQESFEIVLYQVHLRTCHRTSSLFTWPWSLLDHRSLAQRTFVLFLQLLLCSNSCQLSLCIMTPDFSHACHVTLVRVFLCREGLVTLLNYYWTHNVKFVSQNNLVKLISEFYLGLPHLRSNITNKMLTKVDSKLKGCNSQCTLCMYYISKVMLDPAESLVNCWKHYRVSRYGARNSLARTHVHVWFWVWLIPVNSSFHYREAIWIWPSKHCWRYR